VSASSGRGLGQFEVRSGRIGIWDPCYGHGDEVKAANGTWFAEVEMSNEGSWGNRVAKLSAWKDGCYGKTPFKRIAIAGVDSGQMGIYDLRPDIDTDEGGYDEICDITLDKGQAGIYRELGAVSSTGYGDGAYPVRVYENGAGEVEHIEVVFISDEDDEDEDGEDRWDEDDEDEEEDDEGEADKAD
jgi:hypothetical protein